MHRIVAILPADEHKRRLALHLLCITLSTILAGATIILALPPIIAAISPVISGPVAQEITDFLCELHK